MTGTDVRRGVRVLNLAGLAFIGGALVVAGVGFVTGGFMLVALAGGLVIGGLLLWQDWRYGPFRTTDPIPAHDPAATWPRTDPINMSAIRVAGAGGLGLVAMAAAVAVGVPAIGVAMLVALAGGIVAAAFVIRHRQRKGPLSSVDTDPGHHTLV
jgi:hypothetical protein